MNRNAERATGAKVDNFAGFQSLDANFIYCPNQFFDYALRYSNRSTIRLVNHVLYSTLRWLDENSNPIQEAIAVPHRDLRAKVRISKGSYDDARSEALQLHLIEEVVPPQSKAKRQEAVTGCYALKWDHGGEYRTRLGEFIGFFANEGNRTAVPEEFFTFIIPNENLNVIKVVAAVLRHTIG